MKAFVKLFTKPLDDLLQCLIGLGVNLSNRSAYKTSPQETKEIEKQVGDLLKKGWF